MILIASMFLLPLKFLMLSHTPLKDCHMSFLSTLWHVFQNERRKKTLLEPTKSHSKNEKQIREQIQHEAEREESDKRRSKLSRLSALRSFFYRLDFAPPLFSGIVFTI